jgi:ubiquinone/menaquinone biosynthesis C-methylase UbiE
MALPLIMILSLARSSAGEAIRQIRAHFSERLQSKLFAAVERPISGEATAEYIDVKGWAFSARGEQIDASVLIYPGRVHTTSRKYELPLTEDRRDVIDALNWKEAALRCGFTKRFRWEELGTDSDTVSLVISITNGIEYLTFGPIAVNQSAPHSLDNRSDYKSVWNRVSDSPAAARVAVAGFSEENSYDESGRSTANTLTERLAIGPNDTVLEIGCGTARIGNALLPVCKKWIGTDISGKMLEVAAETLGPNTNSELIELTGCNLSTFKDASIDKLYCTAVFMHLDEWDRYRYVSEAFRVVRPGGKVYFDNMDIESEEGWALFSELAKLDSTQRPANISKCSTAAELLTYVRRAGFINAVAKRSGQFIEVTADRP